MPTYIANPTDKNQTERETAANEDGMTVESIDAKTRVISRGRETGAQRTANAGSTLRANAGVIMNNDDVPNRMSEETQGKA
jgi:hypothetical protein